MAGDRQARSPGDGVALWIRLWPAGRNTRHVAHGTYDIRLVVYDTAGNVASRSLRVRGRN